MTDKEKDEFISDKSYEVGQVLNGMSIDDALRVLNFCIHIIMKQLLKSD